MSLTRKPNGSMLIFIVSLLVIVLIIGVAFVCLMTLFGGNIELENAVDAGALTIARRCLTDIHAKADQASVNFFADVTNKDHEVNLENLNYCLAKTMLVEINQMAMEFDGESTDLSARNSSDVFIGAKKLTEDLDRRLSDFDTLSRFYGNGAHANSLRMLGGGTTQLQKPIERAYMDKGDKSSVYFDADGLPMGFNAASLKPLKSEGKLWLPGYVPIDVGGRGFNYVPQPSRPPHLVSQKVFAANMQKPQVHGTEMTADYLPVVANSYKVVATLANKLTATSCSQADCVRDGFVMEIPHGFTQIYQREPYFDFKIHENLAGKYGGNWGKERPYKPLKNDPIYNCYIKLRPQLDKLPTPWEVFTSKLYASDLSTLKSKFLQRTREMLPFCDPSQFEPPFETAAMKEGETVDCFRAYNRIHFKNQSEYQEITALAAWLPPQENEQPDGQAGPNDTVVITRVNYIFNPPCPKTVSVGVKVETIYFFQWQPSTGANGMLGKLTMGRNVFCRFLLPDAPPDPMFHRDSPPLN